LWEINHSEADKLCTGRGKMYIMDAAKMTFDD